MSDYGADLSPDVDAAYDLIATKGFLPEKKANVMQWTYSDRVVRKIARKLGKTNILFLVEKQ